MVLYGNLIKFYTSLHTIEITKVLTKIGKMSGCEAITEWVKPCTNRLYWSARTTHDGNGHVIWAKFSSFSNHVIDKHEGLENPLFNKCGHSEMIQSRKLLDKGIVFILSQELQLVVKSR